MRPTSPGGVEEVEAAHREGRLAARPHVPAQPVPPGRHRLDLAPVRDGTLVVPPCAMLEEPVPLVVGLHGAGGEASQTLALFAAIAEQVGFAFLAVDSRGRSWDLMVARRVGPDVAFLDRALAHTFDRVAVDPERVVIAGFSDGASYALTLGLANGALVRRIVALSPGYAVPPRIEGRPAVYVAHGTEDAVLPIDRSSRKLVPWLEREGYPVVYREFAGPHTIPPEIAIEALEWALR